MFCLLHVKVQESREILTAQKVQPHLNGGEKATRWTDKPKIHKSRLLPSVQRLLKCDHFIITMCNNA